MSERMGSALCHNRNQIAHQPQVIQPLGTADGLGDGIEHRVLGADKEVNASQEAGMELAYTCPIEAHLLGI
jgi:hypothetical protein